MANSNNAENPTTQEVAPTVEVNAVDIVNAVKIIDAAAQRGAFQGSEMSTIGTCRDRLDGYVVHLRAEGSEQADEEAETEEAE